MEVILQTSKNISPKNTFVVVVETMEGDADDTHYINIECKDETILREVIIHTEVMKKCYRNGRGGGDDYVGPYYEKYFEGNIFHYEGICDSIEGFEIFFYDEVGIKYDVSIVMDEEMIEEINNPKMSKEDLEIMNY